VNNYDKAENMYDPTTYNSYNIHRMCRNSCRWKGKNCTHEDFTLTLTDAGVCYTFNAEINADSFVESTGNYNYALLYYTTVAIR